MDYWHLKNKELFDLFKRKIDEEYPTLIVLVVDNLVHIKGTIRIKNDKKIILNSYSINIVVPHNFPHEIPKLYEVGGKIPLISDRHFENDGSACLCLRDEVFLYWDEEKSTIIDFIKFFVEPFFHWQIEYEASGGQNKDDAHAHGLMGAINFYKKILGTDDIKVVYKFIEYLTKKKIKKHWPCFCGSGQQIRYCHFDLMKYYKQKIRSKDANKTLDNFKRTIEIIKNNKEKRE